MRHGDPADPLLRQVLPSLQERTDTGFCADPLGEDDGSQGFSARHPHTEISGQDFDDYDARLCS